MLEKWYAYLSDQKNPDLAPLMESYFNDNIDLEELNYSIMELDAQILTYAEFKKDQYLDQLLDE